jgi:chromosome segregation ATPase
MAAADEILGISGQMDISDIQASLDKLCDGLNRVGVDTEALSQRMNKALNDVAQSDEDLATKTTKAMQVLKSAMDEATKGIQVVPEMIDTANRRVETIEGTIGKLNEQLAKTEKGSEAFGSLTKQIDAQKHSLELAKGDVKDLVESYDGVRNSISQVNGAYQALSAFSVASTSANSVQSATNIAVGATATTAATATSAEAAAHVANAEAATQNAEAENQNVEATKHLTEALQQYISVASGRAEIERMQSESTKELKADIKLYEQAINDIQQKLGSTDYAKNIEEATKKIEIQKEKINSYKEAISNLSSEDNQSGQGANYYNQLIQVAQDNIDSLQSKINAMSGEQQRLNADLREYTTLLEAANQIQGGKAIVQPDSSSSTVSINIEDTSLSELNNKLDESKQRLQELEAETDKFSGKPLGDKQKADLGNLQSEIEKTKNNISVLQEAIREKNEETFIGRLRNQISDSLQNISDFGQSIKDKITQPIDELKSKISGSSIGQRFSEEFTQAKSGLNDFKDGIINVMTANGKLQGEIGKVGEAFKALGIPVTGSLTAIKSVTKALWGMCATPVGAVIAAIALAFKAVHTWMTKSAEGQKVYTKLMAYFGSLAKSITDIVIIFGEYLYKCFTKPNAPLRDFGNNFVKTFKTAERSHSP